MNFGHYVYNRNAYVRKIDAFDEALKNRDYFPNISLWFHDESYAQFDWAQEPLVSLDTLYKMRAKQIRDENEYLILLYSGGADSHQILDTFLKHNIFIDEVRVQYPLK